MFNNRTDIEKLPNMTRGILCVCVCVCKRFIAVFLCVWKGVMYDRNASRTDIIHAKQAICFVWYIALFTR